MCLTTSCILLCEFFDPQQQVVRTDKSLCATVDWFPINEKNEQWDTLNLVPVDEWWVVTGINHCHRNVSFTGDVSQNRHHALADTTPIGIKLNQHSAMLREKFV